IRTNIHRAKTALVVHNGTASCLTETRRCPVSLRDHGFFAFSPLPDSWAPLNAIEYLNRISVAAGPRGSRDPPPARRAYGNPPRPCPAGPVAGGYNQTS